MKALLLLQDGFYLYGSTFAGEGEVFGEVVFNTGMAGYQEVVTDPSSFGQIIIFTYPHIGNYGCRPAENESSFPGAKAVVVKHYCREPQNREARESMADLLNRHGIVGVEGFDTRTLTLHLRKHGAMQGAISTVSLDPEALRTKLDKYLKDPDKTFCIKTTDPDPGSPEYSRQLEDILNINKANNNKEVAVLDFGITFSVLKALADRGCKLKLFSPGEDLSKIKSYNPAGVFISNGPGNPDIYSSLLPEIRSLLGWRPLMGIGMGHQLIGRSIGMETYKMHFGHRGLNHPVKDTETGRVLITRQNHGFNLSQQSPLPEKTVVSHLNLNDNTIEGISNNNLGFFSVQFYPESTSGIHKSKNLYDKFTEIL